MLLFGSYHLLRHETNFSLKDVNYALDTFCQIYDKFILAIDFDFVETESILSDLLYKTDLKT